MARSGSGWTGGTSVMGSRPRTAGGLGRPLLGFLGHPRAVVLRSDDRRESRGRRLPAERLVDLALDLRRHLRVLAQVALGVVASLAEPLVAVGEERPRLLDDVVLHAEVEQAALRRDALPVLDVELGLPERRRDLVLDDLDPHPVADRLGALLERLDAADVEPLRGVELERAAARLSLRRAEHHAHLLPDLVGEGAERAGAVEVA